MESNDIICFPQSTNKMLESNNSSQQNESKIENNSGFLSEPMDNDLYHINNKPYKIVGVINMGMITVKIDSDVLTEMLWERFDNMWAHNCRSTDEEELWHRFFEELIDNEVFNANDFDVAEIVDNSYVNEFRCLTREECIDEYGFDPEEDDDGRVWVYDGNLYIISTRQVYRIKIKFYCEVVL